MIVTWLRDYWLCLLMVILSLFLRKLHHVPGQPDPRPQEDKKEQFKDPHFEPYQVYANNKNASGGPRALRVPRAGRLFSALIATQ